jgi:hypothetical protein
MKLSAIIKSQKQIEEMGHTIENNVIEYVDINTIAHFGNCTCFQIACSNVCPMSTYNNTRNLGFLIRSFVEIMGIDREDGRLLSKIRNIPCRLVFENKGGWGSRCIGFGHFMKDKFVLTEEFVQIDEL